MRLTWSAIGLGMLTLGLACGDPEGRPATDAGEAGAPIASSEPGPVDEPDVEPEAEEEALASTGNAEDGAAHYKMYCATCHGEDGCGDGPLSAGLDPKPAKHCDGSYMNPLSDAYLFKVVKEGGAAVGKSPLMAAWGGSLSDEQIRDVVAYMRSIADPPYSPPGS